MNSQDFLTLNVIGAGAFLVWYLLSRGGYQGPSKLDLKAKDTAPTVLEPEKSPSAPTEPERPAASGDSPEPTTPVIQRLKYPTKKLGAPRAPPVSKELNVMFNYNGHSWDAYEVLGVPAGASISLVTEAYQLALRKCDKESVEFLETAYNAILRKS